jgi:hypothetical protein
MMKATPLQREMGALGSLLLLNVLLAAIVIWRLPAYISSAEYYWPGVEFATTHHIGSTFLSIGYSVLLGIGYRITGSQAGATGVDLVIALAMIAAAWVYLRLIGMTLLHTFWLTLLLMLYPDFLLSYHKIQDTNLTALLLFGFLSAVLLVKRARRWGYADVILSLTSAAAVLVRPNLVLLIPLAWFVMYKFRVPKLLPRAAAQLAIIVFCYVAVTTAVHGRPFLPQNGPYNLYAGANEFTEQHITNPEDSLAYALANRGIHADVRWKRPPDQPGINDLRDTKYRPLYEHLAKQFMREHPGTMVRLTWLKFISMMRPDLSHHRALSAGGFPKILAAFAIPLWFLSMLTIDHPGPRGAKLLIVSTVFVVLLPFLATVSAHRFRVPLDMVCWMDLGAVLVNYRSRRLQRTDDSVAAC